MTSFRLFCGVLFLMSFLGANCGAVEGNVLLPSKGDAGKILKTAGIADSDVEKTSAPQPGVKPVKKWTVMVYANAKNDLELHGLNDVNEMEAVGSGEDVDIVVELGRIKGATAIDGDWTGSRRYLVEKDDNPSLVTSPVLMEIPDSDMGDWKHLVDFTRWSMENFPAQHYMLVVWNHGSGWIKSAKFPVKGISYDFVTGNHMSIPHLGMAMKEIGKIDILAMDACLMQMAEVAYEVKDHAEYIVASEENVPNSGYSYTPFLTALIEKPEMPVRDFTKVIVDAFVEHYQPLRKNVMLSSIKAAALGEFKFLLDDWVKNAMKTVKPGAVISAKSSAQSFAFSENKDVYHFIQILSKRVKDEAFVEKSVNLLNFMDNELIVYNRVSGSRYPNAHGLAICLPNRSYSNYEELKWAADSQWDEFIAWYNKR